MKGVPSLWPPRTYTLLHGEIIQVRSRFCVSFSLQEADMKLHPACRHPSSYPFPVIFSRIRE